MHKCNVCGEEKTQDEFGTQHYMCKQCKCEYNRARYHAEKRRRTAKRDAAYEYDDLKLDSAIVKCDTLDITPNNKKLSDITPNEVSAANTSMILSKVSSVPVCPHNDSSISNIYDVGELKQNLLDKLIYMQSLYGQTAIDDTLLDSSRIEFDTQYTSNDKFRETVMCKRYAESLGGFRLTKGKFDEMISYDRSRFIKWLGCQCINIEFDINQYTLLEQYAYECDAIRRQKNTDEKFTHPYTGHYQYVVVYSYT